MKENKKSYVSKTDYVGNFVYENGSLKFIITDDGRIIPNGSGGFDYEYFITDHLGNTRVTVKDSLGHAAVQQEDHYYPFGMRLGGMTYNAQSAIDNGTENKFLYNGKELQDDLGLNFYDYGARSYSPEIARWSSIDNYSEKYFSYSPYNYTLNNPIRFIDPDGNSVSLANLYDKDKEGNYKYAQQIAAFEVFASTKAGRAYLLARAQKGFKLEGVMVKGLSIEATKDGAIHTTGIDVEFIASNDHKGNYVNEAVTGHSLSEDKSRLQLSIVMSSDQTIGGASPNEILSKARNIGHEVFYHGDEYEKRFAKYKSGIIGLSENGSLWTQANYSHTLYLPGTKWGQIGSSFLRNAESIIKRHDYKDQMFDRNISHNSHRKAYMAKVWRQMQKRFTSSEIRKYHRYGLPNNK